MPKTNRTPKFTEEELAAMTPQQKLDRIVYLNKEISSTRDLKKDQAAAHNDYIKELQAQIKEITDSERNTVPPSDSVQAAQAAG